MRDYQGAQVFSDVDEDKWYYDAVSIAHEYGIVIGNKGIFRPQDKISRQEAMVIAVRAMALAGIDTSVDSSGAYLDKFADSDEVSGWARDSVASCIKNRIIFGSNNALRPQDNISRAEASIIVKRLLNKAGVCNLLQFFVINIFILLV